LRVKLVESVHSVRWRTNHGFTLLIGHETIVVDVGVLGMAIEVCAMPDGWVRVWFGHFLFSYSAVQLGKNIKQIVALWAGEGGGKSV
jgi:hypothetical protein